MTSLTPVHALVALVAQAAAFDGTHSKSGTRVPSELRRDLELGKIKRKRQEVQEMLETAEGNDLLELQNQLLALEQEAF